MRDFEEIVKKEQELELKKLEKLFEKYVFVLSNFIMMQTSTLTKIDLPFGAKLIL